MAANCTAVALHHVFDRNAKTQQVANGNPAGFISSGTAYAPIRFVTTSLGQTVGWDGSSHTITLTAAESASPNARLPASWTPGARLP